MEKFHILIVRFSSLGDVILTTSVISYLRWNFGEKLHLSYLTSQQFAPLLQHHPFIDDVHSFSRSKGVQGLKELAKLVKGIHQKKKIDLIFDMHGTLRSIFLRFYFFQIPRIAVDKRTLERTLLTTFKIDFLSRQGAQVDFPSARPESQGELLLRRNIRDIESIFEGISPLLKNRNKYKSITQMIEKNSSQENLLHQNQLSSCSFTFHDHDLFPHLNKWGMNDLVKDSYICLIPSASFPEKRWAPEKFKKLMKLCFHHPLFRDKKFLILAGPQDDFCDQFNELKSVEPQRFFNLQGKTSLIESTMLLKYAYFCVGNDTGLPHIAEAVGTPAIFILGPTGEEFGFYPHLIQSKMCSKKLWCRPCTTNGKGHCIRSERFCLTLISEEEVLEKMIEMDFELKKLKVY